MYEFASENNINVHTDGARVLNAAVSLGVPVSEVMKYSDSVNMCFSKVIFTFSKQGFNESSDFHNCSEPHEQQKYK